MLIVLSVELDTFAVSSELVTSMVSIISDIIADIIFLAEVVENFLSSSGVHLLNLLVVLVNT